MPFNLFRKKKQPEQEAQVMPPQQEAQPETPEQIQEETPQPAAPAEEPAKETTVTIQEVPQETALPAQESPQETPPAPAPVEEKPPAPEATSKTYLKAMPLRELLDLDNIKTEVKNGNIIILRVTPLAGKSIEDVKIAVNDLFQFADSIGGDIARLGEERVVITPKTVRIWREKTPAPVSSSSEPLPTAA